MTQSPHYHSNFYILTGCSGGGKSTLLAALQKQGVLCVEEAGRQIVRQQEAVGGNALPWKDCRAFCEAVLSHNIRNFECHAKETAPVIFDRGIPEAIGGDRLLGQEPLAHHIRAAETCRYNPCVFIVPPWPEIFVNDLERRHSFDDAVREYDIQRRVYAECGYTPVDVPRVDMGRRVRFILGRIAA